MKSFSGKDFPDSTPPASALRSMQTGQNSLVAERVAPQTMQARISRVIESSPFSVRDFVFMAQSVLRRPPKLRKVHESRRPRRRVLRLSAQLPHVPAPCTVCASDVLASLPPPN